MRVFLLPPSVVLITISLMVLLHRHWPAFEWMPSPAHWLGLLPMAIGIGIAQWHARLFKRVGTNIDTFGEPGTLTTDGLFGRTRNPMYLGMLICLIGVAWLLGTLSPWLGPLGFYLLARTWYIPLEEQAMARKFGDAYMAYQRTVPRWW